MNNKSSILLICLFGLSFLYQASAAAPKQCVLYYEDLIEIPSCDLTGPNDECESTGSAAVSVTLDKSEKTLKESSWPLGVLSWDGDCKCTLKIYSKVNYQGCSLSYPFSKSKTKTIYPKKLLKKDAKSFKVVCSF